MNDSFVIIFWGIGILCFKKCSSYRYCSKECAHWPAKSSFNFNWFWTTGALRYLLFINVQLGKNRQIFQSRIECFWRKIWSINGCLECWCNSERFGDCLFIYWLKCKLTLSTCSSPEADGLLQKMLVVDSNLRISAANTIKHPFF